MNIVIRLMSKGSLDSTHKSIFVAHPLIYVIGKPIIHKILGIPTYMLVVRKKHNYLFLKKTS